MGRIKWEPDVYEASIFWQALMNIFGCQNLALRYVETILKYREINGMERVIPILIAVMIVGAVYLDVSLSFAPCITFLTVAMTEGTLFFYFL